VLAEKAKYFLQFDSMDTVNLLKKVEAGKEILALTDILDPGLSLHRESLLIHIATTLQVLAGDQMIKHYSGSSDEDDILPNEDVLGAIDDAVHYFKDALMSAKLEEALDGSKSATTALVL